MWVGPRHRSNTGPFRRKGVTELLLRSLIPVTPRLLFPRNPAVLGVLAVMSSLTITCNRKESGEVTILFMVRFPVSASTENTSSVFPREKAKSSQPSDSFIK